MRDLRRACERLAFFGSVAASLAAGCLTVPVVAVQPETHATLSKEIKESGVDKIDVLFAIDNSASMGDKQQILSEAIPDLLERLVIPECVDPNDPKTHFPERSRDGVCAQGELEFKPIKDIHVGIVSSSIGGRGSGSCAKDRNDDKARLLNIAKSTAAPLPDAAPMNFLAWYTRGNSQSGGVPNISDVKKLVEDFQQLVEGVGESGCGYEAQLESWYRFLVQPDPYERIQPNGDNAVLVGLDETILKQRRAFLRPDSLVLIVQVTDENESTVDPLAVGGAGWKWASQEAVGFGAASCEIDRIKPTSACAANPTSEACGSCALPQFAGSPECAVVEESSRYTTNLRFFDMKRRLGVDPRFPISRYVTGLGRDPKTGEPLGHYLVPNRKEEHPTPGGPYEGNGSCTNPLFAASLPSAANEELCKLDAGKRTAALVYFATITGVPQKLLHYDPKDPQKSKLTNDDWGRILGKDPSRYDTTGADPLMIESVLARKGLSETGDDGVHIREYDTRNDKGLYTDLQYACTFALKEPRKCADRDCECMSTPTSPLCAASDRTTQLSAKAYPGVRHLEVARALGDNGIVSSICPIETRDTKSELYGYRPAVRAIIDRLVDDLTTQCVERPLAVDAEGRPPCEIVEVLPTLGSDAECDAKDRGLARLDPKARAQFVERHSKDVTDVDKRPICKVEPIVVQGGGSCKADPRAGFCYLHGKEALAATRQKCSDAILFSRAGSPVSGANVFLQCLTSSGDAGQ